MEADTHGEDEIARHLAETTRVYDALPYPAKPIFRTHPSRIAAIASLNGLDPVPPARARVLELGCAAGANLIPLALRYPDAQFVGIDLSPVMIDDGKARVAALGLTNIDLRIESITEFGDGETPYDYIIAHGVYSWVPEPVREALLDICNRLLSPNGIAYVSYNVLPGWRLYQSIRDTLRIVSRASDEAAQARQARGLLNLIAQTTPNRREWGDFLRRVPNMIGPDDGYLYHDYMEPVNEPFMFVDFVGAAARHGLTYMSESELMVMYPQAHGAEFAESLDAVTADLIQQQQMIDIMVGTTFRTSLLVRQSQAEAIDRSAAAERLASLHVTISGIHDHERIAEDQARLTMQDGVEHVVTDPVTVALLDRLFGPAPRAWSPQELAEGLDIDADTIAAHLSSLICNGVAVPMFDPLRAAEPGERPLADALVRLDAAQGRATTSNLMHMPIGLTPSFLFLLPHLDGSRTQAELVDLVVVAAREGTIRFAGGEDASPETLAATARAMVSASLEAMAGYGLLLA